MQRWGILVRLFRKANPNDLQLRKRNNSGFTGPNFWGFFSPVRQIFAAARREADGERGGGSGSDANTVVINDQRAAPGAPEAKQRWRNTAANAPNTMKVKLGGAEGLRTCRGLYW